MNEETLKTEELPKTTSNVVEAIEIKQLEPEKASTQPNETGVGRPTVFTPQTIDKLEQVFALGGTDLEACFFAGIGKSALYNYQAENPEFVERKEALKQKPILKARQTVITALDQPQHAQWFLERKMKKEFAQRLENTGAEGKDLVPLTLEQQNKLDELLFKKNNQDGETKH